MAELSQDPSQSRSLHEKVDQKPLNDSESQSAASSTHDRQHTYRKRDYRANQGAPRNPETELNPSTENVSAYSYHSGTDLSSFIREIDGRMFNAQSDLYVLPSDEGEFKRLDKQHYAFVLGQGGLYPSQCRDVVQDLLSSSEGGGKHSILDIGCGSGIWTIQIAREFPDCEVVGLDLAPSPIDVKATPPNCRFEIDDVNLGLGHYHGKFDLIHVRCIGSGLTDHAKVMRDIEACLKPGGIVFFIDGDTTVCQEDKLTPLPVGQERDEEGDPAAGSWVARIMRELRYAAIYNGSDVSGLEKIDEGMWDHELLDPSTVRVASLCTPVGTWARANHPDTQQRLTYVGSLLRQTTAVANRAFHPILKKYGIPQETLDRWSERIDQELTDDKFRMCYHWMYTWGRRRAATTDNVPVPAVGEPPIPNAAEDSIRETEAATTAPAGTSSEFKFMDVYDTKEEAVAVMAERRARARDLPVPMVVRIRTSQA